MVTLVGICGDPHYTSCTYPGNFFFWRWEVSVRVGWDGACGGEKVG